PLHLGIFSSLARRKLMTSTVKVWRFNCDWGQESLSQDEGLECGSQEVAEGSGSQEVAGRSGSQEVAGPSGLTQSQVPSLRLPHKRPRKGRNVEEAALALIRDAHATLREPSSVQEGYGCIVAAKMQEMEEGQRLLCENIILQTLNKGLSGQMAESTHLSEFVHPPPPPPPPATNKKCQDDWIQFENSCYYISKTKFDWTEARTMCQKKESDLLVINSAKEQLFIAGKTNPTSFKRFWLGLHDTDEEGLWKWVDETNYETSYKSWTKGEPNNHGDEEDCALLWTNGEWNDVPCSYENSYAVCEQKL
ncbi:hypothetical protein AB205_0110130, partial [Aquarana catesbeiana]